jgi:hypothetical protein
LALGRRAAAGPLDSIQEAIHILAPVSDKIASDKPGAPVEKMP